jgi:hypothetical protein
MLWYQIENESCGISTIDIQFLFLWCSENSKNKIHFLLHRFINHLLFALVSSTQYSYLTKFSVKRSHISGAGVGGGGD